MDIKKGSPAEKIQVITRQPLKFFWPRMLTNFRYGLYVILLILTGISSAAAAQVSLAWDPSSPKPDGYRLYQRTTGTSYNYDSPSWAGPTASCTISNLSDGTQYYFVVRAYTGTTESGDSNEVAYKTAAAATPTPAPTPSPTPTPAPAAVTPVTYTITASAGTNGTISPSGGRSVSSGGSATYTITPNSGYHITSVTVDGASVGVVASYTFSNVNANHTISANFAMNTYAITASAGTNGTISPSGSSVVSYGGSLKITISPNTGCSIASVLVDGTSVGAVTSYTFSNVTANHTVSATFAVNAYTITATAGTNGAISPSGSRSVNYGGNASFTIIPNAGYQISSVLVDNASVGAMTSYTFNNVTTNHTISATFSKINQAPVANAGPDQTVAPKTKVILNGSGSADPDGNTITYTWTQTAGQTVTLSSTTSAKPTFTSPQGSSSPITLTFLLTVKDSSGLSSSDSCQVIVQATQSANTPPVAEAGPNQTVTAGSSVTLNGSGSYDPEGKALTYLWTQTSGTTVQLSPNNVIYPTFTAPAVAAGQTLMLAFELRVTDDLQASSADTCIVQVNAAADGTPNSSGNSSQTPQNNPPLRPEILYPIEGATGLSTTPTLKSSNFSDPDAGDSLASSEWLITKANTQTIVLQASRNFGTLNSLRVPRLVLSTNTTYSCQVRYTDNDGLTSEWSTPITFTTKTSKYTWFSSDVVNDLLSVGQTDLNNNNIPDADEPQTIRVISTLDGQMQIGISSEAAGSSMDAAAIIDPAAEEIENRPQDIDAYDLFTYRVLVSEPGATTSVNYYLSNGVNDQDTWLCHQSDGQWIECTSAIAIKDHPSAAARMVQDGGPEDSDGIANGVIIDILGVKKVNSQSGNISQGLEDSNQTAPTSKWKVGSCFIESMLDGF